MNKIDRVEIISTKLHAAILRKQEAVEQMVGAIHEVAKLECDLKNAKRKDGDTRPLENVGNLKCIPHEWHGDPEHEQYFCGKEGCGARFDVGVPELGYESLPNELVAELLAGPIDIGPEELQNATEKAAEVLRSEYLSQKEVNSLLRGVCGDDAQENINKLGFPGSTKNVNPEQSATTAVINVFEGMGASVEAGHDWGDGVGDTHPTFDPDVHISPQEKVSTAGWESVQSGGFSKIEELPFSIAYKNTL